MFPLLSHCEDLPHASQHLLLNLGNCLVYIPSNAAANSLARGELLQQQIPVSLAGQPSCPPGQSSRATHTRLCFSGAPDNSPAKPRCIPPDCDPSQHDICMNASHACPSIQTEVPSTIKDAVAADQATASSEGGRRSSRPAMRRRPGLQRKWDGGGLAAGLAEAR